MRRGLAFDLLLPLVVFILPLALVADRIAHPGPWLGVLTAWTILFTQPALTPKEMVQATGPDRRSALGIYIGMVTTQLVAILFYGYGPYPTPAVISPWTLAGAAMVVLGMAYRIWSIRTLGQFFTAVVMVQEGQRVIQTGPYRWTRHPSYTGAIIAALGMLVAMRSVPGMILWLVLLLPVYAYRIRVEERKLSADFGPEYVEYMKKSWRLIPGIF